MDQSSIELRLSLVVVFFLATVYVIYELVAIPSGGHPFGHALGVIGALLMVMTEMLYSARKRLPFIRFGRVRHWLSFHIFTGITGPALVLMHTGFEFRGLAGLTALLTGLVVASGFLGRYIYTAVPRTLAGIEVDRRTLELEIAAQQAALQHWLLGQSEATQAFIAAHVQSGGASTEDAMPVRELLLRRFTEWREARRIQRALRRQAQLEREKIDEIDKLLRRQRRLQRQIRSLATVRRLMGLWHTAHVPLGLTLFVSIFIHIVATIYYGALS